MKPIKDGLGHADLCISRWILTTVDFWHHLGATPNALTTLGNIATIVGLFYMYKRCFHAVVVFALLRWYFDYADGMLARKFDQTTVFGDWYDHISDLLFVIGILVILLIRSKKYKFVSAGIFLFFVLLALIQTGCAEKENEDEEKNSLSVLEGLCVAPETMKYFDTTLLYVVTLILIALFVSREYNIFDRRTVNAKQS